MGSFIGIDTHKDSLSCSAVDEVGREIESVHAINDGRGFRKIERFAHSVEATRIGIECSGSFGLALAQHLLAAGFDVKEVPGQLVKRDRRSLSKAKSDTLDALLIARVVARECSLPPPPLEGLAHDLKALVDHRETLLNEATRHRNRGHAILTQIRPGYSRAVPALTSSRQLDAARDLVEGEFGVRASVLRDALTRVAELDSTAKALEKQIDALVKASGTSPTQIVGVAGAIRPTSVARARRPDRKISARFRETNLDKLRPWDVLRGGPALLSDLDRRLGRWPRGEAHEPC